MISAILDSLQFCVLSFNGLIYQVTSALTLRKDECESNYSGFESY